LTFQFYTCLTALLFILVPSTCRAQADFTITGEAVGPALIGFGVQANPYLYCTPNSDDVNDENVKDFEAKVLALRPQHVRIFFRQQWFDGEADAISQGDARITDSFIRACMLAQRAGATINLTYWDGPWPNPEEQMTAFVKTLDELVNEHQLTAIRFVTVQNEVNGTKLPMETYNSIYHSLDSELRKRQLRDRIQIISGDLVQNNQHDWFQNLGEHLAKVSDGYSIHVYWDYWGSAKLVRRISEVSNIVQSLPREQQRPLFVTEFGVRGRRPNQSVPPGDHEDGTPIAMKPLQAAQLAWLQMEAMNRGYVATVIWTLEDAWYDRFMSFGIIGAAKDEFPLKPGYYMLQLFTHTIEPGWHAVKIDGKAQGCIVSAARGPAGDITVLALNKSNVPRQITIAGLSDNTYSAVTWNQEGDGRICRAEVANQSGVYFVTLPPIGMTALTTVDTQSLTEVPVNLGDLTYAWSRANRTWLIALNFFVVIVMLILVLRRRAANHRYEASRVDAGLPALSSFDHFHVDTVRTEPTQFRNDFITPDFSKIGDDLL
jgi:hypothetical protein